MGLKPVMGYDRQAAGIQSRQLGAAYFYQERGYYVDCHLLVKYLRCIASYHQGLWQHSIGVARLSLTIARLLELDGSEQQNLLAGALLHDIGKTQISRQIIEKTGYLTPAEWEEIRRHPALGAQMLRPHQELAPILPLVYYHHERWDGQGYYGLQGDQSPLLARIITLADAVDAMTAPRPYREARPPQTVARELAEQNGRQFDPAVIQAVTRLDLASLLAEPISYEQLAAVIDISPDQVVAEPGPAYYTRTEDKPSKTEGE